MRGTTLIELMIALAVAGIVISAAVISGHALLAQYRATAAINHIIGAVQYARHAAVSLRGTVTVCPGFDGACARRNEWHRGIVVFKDENANGRVDFNDNILIQLPALGRGERIYWRSFGNRSYLQINARGLTNWQNGHLLYCPPDGDEHYAREIIINVQARVRSARDADGDGIIEDARGRPVVCPDAPRTS
ncbi:MAG: GspH/FimT family pseudopilin [Gammaproteobacteria bacterium]|nr:GspH/FimT family pseudopilin [Gammaproteobacteria bacterium]